MVHYYLSDGQQPRGPFPLTELRAQGLTATSLVWHEQLPDWLPAPAVPEVQALLPKAPPSLPKTPPPVPPRTAQPPVIPPPARVAPPVARVAEPPVAPRPAKPALPARRTWFMLGGGAVVALGLLLAFRSTQPAAAGWAGGTAPNSSLVTDGATTAPADPAGAVAAAEERTRQAEAILAAEHRAQQQAWNRTHLLEYVSPSVLPGYEVGTFGGISGGRIQLSNNSGYRLQNVLVAVQYIKAAGDVYKTEYVPIDHLPAHQTATQAVPDCSRGVRLSCSVYQLTAPGLDYTFDASRVE